LKGKGFVRLINPGKRNQSVIATPEGIEMIKDYKGWSDICSFQDECAKDY